MATQERSAVDWLAGLDTTILKAWNEQAAAEDAADAAAEVARRGHCGSCGGWTHFRPGEPDLCFGCQVPEPVQQAWQVVGMHRRTRSTRLVERGLSREEAVALREKVMYDPLLTGFSIFIEREDDPWRWVR
jgi:hypothetical protein